jgi:putative peptide zinc metalloprotease protein
MAIATKDNSTVYDVAFALVYADKDTVLNKNEAYAFASCKKCTAVAVAFQVVLIVGNAHVVSPENISAAVSYNCIRCATAALAVQLDVSIPGKPDATTTQKLNALWAKIQAFGKHLRGLTFLQIHAQLVGFEKQILAIVKPSALAPPSASGSASATPPTSTAPAPGQRNAPSSTSGTTPAQGSTTAADTSSSSSAPTSSAATSSAPDASSSVVASPSG